MKQIQRNKKGVIIEKLRLVTHSMSGAYGKGYAQAIVDYAYNNRDKCEGLVIDEYDIAPYQTNMQKAVIGVSWENHFTTVVRNIVSAGVAKKYAVGSSGELCDDGTYPYGVLTSTTTTDEDGRSITIYSNIHENTILERRGTGNDTYYVYDAYGRLCYVKKSQDIVRSRGKNGKYTNAGRPTFYPWQASFLSPMQFIGTYRYDGYSSKDGLYINNVVTDSKSRTSLGYHIPLLENRRRSQNKELGDTYQFYIWKSKNEKD